MEICSYYVKIGFVTKEDSEDSIDIDIDMIIKDCIEFDDRMISDKDVEGSLDYFYEADYGLSGFFARYTSIDRKDVIEKHTELGLQDPLQGKLEGKNISHQEIGKTALETLAKKEPKEEEKRVHNSIKVAFAHMATGYMPRSTIMTAAQRVADGAMMQIGCSQGKTTVLAMASYIDMQEGKKVMNTSSNPGLVMDNFGEFIEPYRALGVDDQMCAITRDSSGKDMVTTREKLRRFYYNSNN